MSADGWSNVTDDRPCEVCAKPDWCSRSDDGAILCRRESIAPNGFRVVKALDQGAVFRPIESRKPSPRERVPRRVTRSAAPVDLGSEVEAIRARSASSFAKWSAQLGVRADAIEAFGGIELKRDDIDRLRVGFKGACPDVALAFPEYDAADRIVGLSVRASDDQKGGVKGSRRGIAQPLRRLNPLRTLYVTEGVSDAVAAASIELQSIARPANNAGKDAFEALVAKLRAFDGRIVFVLDADAAGDASISLCERVAAELDRQLHFVRPPTRKDVRDWLRSRLESGVGLDDREALRSIGLEFAAHVERSAQATVKGGSNDDPRLVSDIEPRTVDWIWPSVLARRFATLVCGQAGSNKSTLLAYVAARVTRGEPLPGGAASAPAKVLYVAGEDRESETIRPRLEAAGADLSRVVLPSKTLVQSGDIEEILRWAETGQRLPAGSLIVVDPISTFVWRGFKDNEATDVRKLLRLIEAYAERNDWAIVLIRHPNKAIEGPARLRVAGSGAWVDEPRISWCIAFDADRPDFRLIAKLKVNVTSAAEGFSFRVDVRDVKGADPQPVASKLVGGMMRSADDILAAADESGESKSVADDAREQLDARFPHGASIDSKEIHKWAADEGISKTTLRRAAKSLGINTRGQRPQGFTGPVHWTRPPLRSNGSNDGANAEDPQAGDDSGVRSVPPKSESDGLEGNERDGSDRIDESDASPTRSDQPESDDETRDDGTAGAAA